MGFFDYQFYSREGSGFLGLMVKFVPDEATKQRNLRCFDFFPNKVYIPTRLPLLFKVDFCWAKIPSPGNSANVTFSGWLSDPFTGES